MIRTYELTRRFGNTTAVDGLTVTVSPGRITALLGPNGAGKTTTLNMLTTLLPPTSGTAEVAGHDILADPLDVRRAIGYVPEHGAVYEGLTADEYLELAGAVHGLDAAAVRERATRLLEYLDVAGARERRLAAHSKGMRRKVLVTAALLHDPPVLLLDEPMDGLDARSQQKLVELLRDLARAGKTILYSSHVLQQVEEMCDELVLIHEGRLRWTGSLASLRETHDGASLREIFLALTATPDGDTVPAGAPPAGGTG